MHILKLHVFTQFYRPKDDRRWSEVLACLEKNGANPEIDVLHVLYERQSDLEHIDKENPRLNLVPLADRLNYGMWLTMTQNLAQGDISILINSDIYLDKTVRVLKDAHAALVENQVFLALTRYNPVGSLFLLNKNPHWTQDVWGVVAPGKPYHTALLQETAFNLGQPGCDNKIAYVMHSYGFRVSNPCRQWRTVHLHADESRRYDSRADKLIGLHAFVHPSESPAAASKLDIELLTRARDELTDLNLNNWINQRPSFRLQKPIGNSAPALASTTSPAALQVPKRSPPIAPSSKVGRVAKPDSSVQAAPAPKPAPPVQKPKTPYSDVVLLKRHEIGLSGLQLVETYSPLLSLYSDAEHFYFVDLGWPTVTRITRKSLPRDFADLPPVQRFVYGFTRHKLVIHPYEIHDFPRYQGHTFYWQQPARTEQDAWVRLADTVGHNLERQVCHVAIGLPWATFIDLKAMPTSLLRLIGERLGRLRAYLESQFYKLRVHTVCQHIFWRQFMADFSMAGITDLWVSHKLIGEDRVERIVLHAWPLFPVNVLDPERSIGLIRKPVEDRKVFASFTGAYMPHYISDVRKRLLTLKNLPGYQVSLTDSWHFNNAVYNEQLQFRQAVQTASEALGARKYNALLSDSVFSLCPSGAGPNSIRLWEALGAGSIPVVLADTYQLPKLRQLAVQPKAVWRDAVIVHPEADLDGLDKRLRAMKPTALRDMQTAGQMIHQCLWAQHIRLAY